MKKSIAAVAATLLLGVTLAACSDSGRSPLAPRDGSHPDALLGLGGSTSQTVYGALWKTPLEQNLNTTATIGPLGGTLRLPATGLTVLVPPGAVLRNTTFGVTALAGRVVAYDFQPSGTRFLVPLVVTQSSAPIDMAPPLLGLKLMRPAYFKSATDIDQQAGTATVSELLPQITIDLLGNINYVVPHFSGYIVSWAME